MRRISTRALILSLLLPLAAPCSARDGGGALPSLGDEGPQIVPDTDLDCNGNQTADFVEIIHEPALDTNGNGLIDHWGSCPGGVAHCLGDLDGDALVDVEDLIILILHWG